MKPETRMQIDLVAWMRKEYPGMLFTSTQAGDRRSKLAAIMMKRMGYTNGTPDLLIFEPRANYCGLFLELKSPDGRLSDDQRVWAQKARDTGYLYHPAFRLEEVKSVVKQYLDMPKPNHDPYVVGRWRSEA